MVYGTIIGIFGNRDKNFKADLTKQIDDFKSLSKNQNLCIIGNYNISFSGNYYFNTLASNELKECFAENLTQNLSETIDHITISQKFIANAKIVINEWEVEKKLSNHQGISLFLN